MDRLKSDSTKAPGAPTTSNDVNAPLRPKASPRSTPSNSICSSFCFRVASEKSESASPSSEEGSPIRGRTLVRVPAHEYLEPRAMTRLQAGPNVGDLHSSTMSQRLLSRDLSYEPDDIDGSYMEPLPYERFRSSSISEELHKFLTFNSSIDLTNFGGHRDTFALLGLRRVKVQGPELPVTFFQRLLDYIGFEEYLALRLSCRCWSAGITSARPPVMPSVYRLPAEVLEKVYECLSPNDLNAARHTCRAWMIDSLEERLLARALKEGGWWKAAKADIELHEELKGQRTPDSINEEWLLSKRLATECSLRPDWTGNGLIENLPRSAGRASTHGGVALMSKTDFSELSTGYYPNRMETSQQGSAIHFTVSVCGKYVLITEGCLIYIYSLRDNTQPRHFRGGHLSPVTTVVCPHRVLAVSMDTSSQRFAVAALLEGRVGLVCDLHENMPSSSRTRSTSQASSKPARDCRVSLYSSTSSGEPLLIEADPPCEHATFRTSPSSIPSVRAIPEASSPAVQGILDVGTFWRNNEVVAAHESGFSQGFSANSCHRPPKTGKRPVSSFARTGPIPLESGIRSIYRNLCSVQDPPRSVAICPQRRCVAFGCSVGIELHWIDALTGQDLNRWFPLTAPSDFLYFLPPRSGVDSAKKLRLISSACHPKQKEGLIGKFFPDTDAVLPGQHGMTWVEGLSDPNARDGAWRGSGWCDHYRAVPIGDGWNVLFTDPVEGNLCLGTDAPPGAGVTKLTRRFIFMGPSESEKTVIPRIYAAGGDLRWGVRIAVGYGEAIWLFVLPPDFFFDQQKKTAERQEQQDLVTDPMRIEGVKIGDMPGLVDLAVDASGGDLTIWSFAVNGMAYVWQIAGQEKSVEDRVVLKDGAVTAVVDADGDTYMSNSSHPAVHFDGSAPSRATDTNHTNATCIHPCIHDFPPALNDRIIDQSPTSVDQDGDIIMHDADVPEDEGYASNDDDDDDDEELALASGPYAIHAPPIWGHWSDDDADWVPDFLVQALREGGEGDDDDDDDEGLGVDVLELTRLEVEVLCG